MILYASFVEKSGSAVKLEDDLQWMQLRLHLFVISHAIHFGSKFLFILRSTAETQRTQRIKIIIATEMRRHREKQENLFAPLTIPSPLGGEGKGEGDFKRNNL